MTETTFEPMLAVPFRGDVEKAMMDDNLWFEQKLDGERLLAVIAGKTVEAYSRTGTQYNLSGDLDAELSGVFGNTGEAWVLDGEYLDNRLWVFDVLMAEGKDTTGLPLETRKNLLIKVFDKLDKPEHVGLLRAKRQPEEKHALYEKTLTGNMEGVMIKDKRQPYYGGKRSRFWMKVKHTETADVVVIETGLGNTGRAVSVGMYEEDELVEVASVKIPFDDLIEDIEPGTILEIVYLYATTAPRLYQPVFRRIRTDKTATECKLEGLKLPEKQNIVT